MADIVKLSARKPVCRIKPLPDGMLRLEIEAVLTIEEAVAIVKILGLPTDDLPKPTPKPH